MAKANGRKKRDRGGIDALPSGAIRVRVYAASTRSRSGVTT
ncbi:hypothetical protein [Kribbella sp. NBC_00889]|nr:hypothetical protein OG817_33005 [Kribbella sp. NBC_00889]